MSQTEDQSRYPAYGLRPGFIATIVFFGILFFLLMSGIGFGVLGLVITLLFGWISFIVETAPRISWDWGTICLYVLVFGSLIFLTHNFTSWLTRNISSARGKNLCWPVKWTLCGVFAICLCLLIAMAVAGIAHQFVWLLESDEPMYENRPKYLQTLRDQQAVLFALKQIPSDWNSVAQIKDELANVLKQTKQSNYLSPNLIQTLHVLVYAENEKIMGILVFPRDPGAQRLGGMYLHGETIEKLDSNAVKDFYKTNEANLQAL